MIDSIIETTKLNVEIIVVDNNSRTDEYKKIQVLNDKKNIKLIRSKANLGFSGGNMLGEKHSCLNSKYLFFLNNDIALLNDALDILFKSCEQDGEIGLISPQHFDEFNNKISSFRYFPNALESFFGKSYGDLISKKKRYSNRKAYGSIIEVGVVSGASLFFNRKCFNQIKGFDTNFFLYCEEEDISKRVWDEGFKVCFNGSAKIIHFCGKSTARTFEIEREFIISYFRLINKHLGLCNRSLLKLFMFLKFLRKKNVNKTKLLKFILTSQKDKYSLKYSQIESEE
jgi:GT2 family glycosyltransferase